MQLTRSLKPPSLMRTTPVALLKESPNCSSTGSTNPSATRTPRKPAIWGFNGLKNLLKVTPAAAQQWLHWATTSGLVLRGAEAKCRRCGYKQWRPLVEIVPSLICYGCGHSIENPHGFNHIEYRYRASQVLLRAMSYDVLAHVLPIRYISVVMGGRDGAVFGAYPGIELRQPGSADPAAEADVFIALRNGGLILGVMQGTSTGASSKRS